MENFKETRWRQRFANLSRAFDLYQDASALVRGVFYTAVSELMGRLTLEL